MNAIRRICGGYILVESLISLLVAAVGVLGLISMQSFLLSRHLESQMRIQASQSANQLISMSVADRQNAACYTIPIASQAGCGSATSRAFTQAWYDDVVARFPGATTLTPTAAINGSNNITVTIRWKRASSSLTHNHIATSNLGS